MSRPITKLSNYEGTCYYIKSAWVQREGEDRGHISLKNIAGMWDPRAGFLFTQCHCFVCSAFVKNRQGFSFLKFFFRSLFAIRSYWNVH